MKDLHPDAWVFADGQWLHRPWWKVAVNALLRSVQPWPRKIVIYTLTATTGPDREDVRPRAVGFGIGRVLHRGTT